MAQRGLQIGAIVMALGVALGAFGAHGLEKLDLAPRALEYWGTAVQYHFLHGLALIVVGILSRSVSGPKLTWAARCFVIGIFLFSGSLYAIALGAPKWLGAITPLGGVAFIAGWLAMAWGVQRRARTD